jgi:hypothetical protein
MTPIYYLQSSETYLFGIYLNYVNDYKVTLYFSDDELGRNSNLLFSLLQYIVNIGQNIQLQNLLAYIHKILTYSVLQWDEDSLEYNQLNPS